MSTTKTKSVNFRETLGKGRKTPIRTARMHQLYIQRSRIEIVNNVRLDVQEEVSDGWAASFARGGQVTPIEVARYPKSERANAIDPLTGLEKVILVDGHRRIEAVDRCIARNWFDVDSPAMVDENGTVWVSLQINDDTDITNNAERLLHQAKKNSTKENSLPSMVELCYQLIDVEKELVDGTKLSAKYVAGELGIKRETVQQYLRIRRGGGPGIVNAMLNGELPQTGQLADVAARWIKDGEATIEEIVAAANKILKAGSKVTKDRLIEEVKGSDEILPPPLEGAATLPPAVQEGTTPPSTTGNGAGSLADSIIGGGIDRTGEEDGFIEENAEEPATASQGWNFIELITEARNMSDNSVVQRVLGAVLQAKDGKWTVDQLHNHIENILSI